MEDETKDLKLLFRWISGGKPAAGPTWRERRDRLLAQVSQVVGADGTKEDLLRLWSRSLLDEKPSKLGRDEAGYLEALLHPDTQERAGGTPAQRGTCSFQTAALEHLGKERGWSKSQYETNRIRIATSNVPELAAEHLSGKIPRNDLDVPRTLGPGTVIFAYGSLLSPTSLGETLGRRVSLDEYVPATLSEHKLAWGVPIQNRNLVDQETLEADNEAEWLALVLQKSRGHSVDGALVAVNDAELARLHEREARYECKSVTNYVHADGLGSRQVSTFIPTAFDAEISTAGCIRRGYVEMVFEARKNMGLSTDFPPMNRQLDFVDPDTLVRQQGWPQRKASEGSWTQTVDNFLSERKCVRSVHHSETAPSLPRPIVVSEYTFDSLREAAELVVREACKQLKTVLMCGDVVEEYGISAAEAEFARAFVDRQPLPEVARVDLLAHCGNVKVLEINSDSPAGIHHFSALAELMDGSWPQVKGRHVHIPGSLAMEHAVDAIRKACPSDLELHTAAIVEQDPEAWPSFNEMLAFRDLMRSRWNCDVVIREPQQLSMSDAGELLCDGSVPVQLVYKRALWADLQNDGGAALLSAGARGTVGIANSPFARLAGNKRLLADLSPTEAGKYVPETHVASANNRTLRDDVKRHPDDWVLKGFRGFGGKEFLAVSIGSSRSVWQKSVDEIFDRERPTHIVQRRQRHGHFAIETEHRKTTSRMKAIFGAYVINGTCAGIEAKLGHELPISMNNRGVRAVVGTLRTNSG